MPSEESESQIDAGSSWSKPCLQVELENEDPISAKSLKVSGENKSPQINIYSHFCLWFNIYVFLNLTSWVACAQCCPSVVSIVQYFCWMLERTSSVLKIHRMEGGWVDCQSAAEDASLLEQAAEPPVSTELKGNGALLFQGYSSLFLFLFVYVILSTVVQVLAGRTDRSNGNVPHQHNITVLQPQVSGFYSFTLLFVATCVTVCSGGCETMKEFRPGSFWQ